MATFISSEANTIRQTHKYSEIYVEWLHIIIYYRDDLLTALKLNFLKTTILKIMIIEHKISCKKLCPIWKNQHVYNKRADFLVGIIALLRFLNCPYCLRNIFVL